jgi:hypothetical protein
VVRVLRACYALLAVVIVASMTIDIVLIVNGTYASDSARVGVAVGLFRFFSYFTIQSNLFVLAMAVTLMRAPNRDGRIWRVARLDSLIGIVITGVVYAVVLAPQQHLTGWSRVATTGLHYISPIATVLLWLVFGPRPRIDWRSAGWAFAWPIAWIVYTFVHGAITGWYPYSFLNVVVKGYAGSLVYTAAIFVIAFVLALVFKGLDRLPVLEVSDAKAR